MSMRDQIEAAVPKRAAALARCNVLDTPREPAFDNIVFTAAQLLRVPMAAIGLLDGDRCWFKARVGPLPAEAGSEASHCSAVLAQDAVFVLDVSSTDPRPASPASGSPRIRFCAGAKVTGSGAVGIGALLVYDVRSRLLGPNERTHLQNLARQASALLTARA